MEYILIGALLVIILLIVSAVNKNKRYEEMLKKYDDCVNKDEK